MWGGSVGKPKWTRGPWRIEENNRGERTVWAGRGAEARLIVPAGDKLEQNYFLNVVPQEERKANLELIAVATDMYDALKAAVAWLTETLEGKAIPQINGEPGLWLSKANAAIAKAEGRPSE